MVDFLQEFFKQSNINRQNIIEKWQKDKRKKLTNIEKQMFCSGCKDNFYNGNNPYNIQKCWCLDKAKVQKRRLYLSINSAETEEIITLDCYRRKLK